jgi:hypothetical protein
MSEKGQGGNGGDAAGAGAGTAPPAGSEGPPDHTDPSGSAPSGGGGGGQQADQSGPKKKSSTGGSTTFADGGKLELNDGKWRYTDPSGRTGLWESGDSWVDEGSGKPMPSDFQGRAPDSQGLEEGLRQREGR